MDPGSAVPEWARAALAGVYDPCCREKGISVVDMGLLRSVAVTGGHARVELLLTSGWCPFASRVLTEVEEAMAAPARRRRAPRSRSSGTRPGPPTGCRRPPARKLRFLPDPTAVPRPGRLRRRPTAHRINRGGQPMIGDAFVFDGVAHPFNFTPKNAFGQAGRDVRQPPLRLPPGADPGHRAEALGRGVPQGLDARRHPRDGLRRLRHRHARRDAAAAHRPVPRRPLAVGGLRGAGVPRPGPDGLLGLGEPARGPPGARPDGAPGRGVRRQGVQVLQRALRLRLAVPVADGRPAGRVPGLREGPGARRST